MIKRKRATREEKARRYEAIHLFLDEGYRPVEIVAVLCEKEGITASQAYKDVRTVKKDRGKTLTDTPLREFYGDSLCQAERLYRKAVKEGDLKTALQCLDKRLKIVNLYKKESCDATPEDQVDIEDVIEEFLQKSKKSRQ